MNLVIIVAAGKGARMGIDKLWLPIEGVPVIGHTWRAFDRVNEVDRIVIVARDDRRQDIVDLVEKIQVTKPYDLVSGGRERQDSVWNGIEACPKDCDLVAIQDAARPCTHPDLIQTCFLEAEKHGAVVGGQRITDTLKRVDDSLSIETNVDRERLWSVQTPQVFRLPLIKRALEMVRSQGRIVTDDTAACEMAGIPVKIVPSEHPNPKVTYPNDLPYISWLLANASRDG